MPAMKNLPFIPAWLDDAGLSQAEFRVYCHLCRRADNKKGIAWPRADSIARDCIMCKDTVWKVLRSLESKGLIRRLGKPFGKANRYRILSPPIGGNEGPVEQAPIGGNQAPQSAEMRGHQSAEMDGWEGSPMKVHQGRVSNSIAETIYQAYPRKVAKPDALKAIRRAMKEHDPDFLIERTKAYASAIEWKDKQFIPYPATWFNKGMFNDDSDEWKQPVSRPVSTVTVNTGRRRGHEESLTQQVP